MSDTLIVAGPCSAETEEQVFRTAELLADMGVEYYRAGIWKPRTSPNSFDGVGSIGLPWLQRVRKSLRLSVGTEVAKYEHIISVAEAEMDFVWLGARTVTNPFAVQEIADAFAKCKVSMPVFVKNPVIPDIALWIGAIERLRRAGITQIVAVHRGFYMNDSIYRNSPQWQVPIEFKRRMPDVKLLCDPSHIAGDSTLVETIIRQASKLGFDGLMVEVHNDPQQALSDKQQQITPLQLKRILGRVRFGYNDDNTERLSVFRAQIDELDRSLIDIIVRRMRLSDEIGEYKRDNDIAVFQPARYEELLDNIAVYAMQKNLNPDFAKQLVELIHQESINRQL